MQTPGTLVALALSSLLGGCAAFHTGGPFQEPVREPATPATPARGAAAPATAPAAGAPAPAAATAPAAASAPAAVPAPAAAPAQRAPFANLGPVIQGPDDGIPSWPPGSAAAPAPRYGHGPAKVTALSQVLAGAMGLKASVRPSSTVATAASTASGVLCDPRFLAVLGARFGEAAVAGVLAHELGHLRRRHPLAGRGRSSAWQHARELEADLEAGCALARLRIDPRDFIRATVTLAGTGSHSHPDGRTRHAAIVRGYRTCAAGRELAKSEILPDPTGYVSRPRAAIAPTRARLVDAAGPFTAR